MPSRASFLTIALFISLSWSCHHRPQGDLSVFPGTTLIKRMARQTTDLARITARNPPLTQRPKAVLGGSATQIQGLAVVISRPVTPVGECGAPAGNRPFRLFRAKPVDPQETQGIHMPMARPLLKGSQGRRIPFACLVKKPAHFSVAVLGDQFATHVI